MDEILLRIGLDPALAGMLRLGLLGRLVLSAVIGGLIGLEREIRGKPAGLRTNLLICVGATLLLEVSVSVAGLGGGVAEGASAFAIGDPGRIAAQIVSGIGFLGAGTIIQARGSVTGLTTAATLWVVAAIGMAIGARMYVEAIGTAGLVGISLVLLARAEDELIRRRRVYRYSVTLDPDPHVLSRVESAFSDRGLRIETEAIDKTDALYEVVFDVSGRLELHAPAVRALATIDGVRRMTRDL